MLLFHRQEPYAVFGFPSQLSPAIHKKDFLFEEVVFYILNERKLFLARRRAQIHNLNMPEVHWLPFTLQRNIPFRQELPIDLDSRVVVVHYAPANLRLGIL